MSLTEWVLLGTVIGLASYDIYIAMTKGVMQTLSVVIWVLSQRYPIIPFAAGILCGHLFAPLIGFGCK